MGQHPLDKSALREMETVPLESHLDGDKLEQFRFRTQKLIEIRNEVARKEVAGQTRTLVISLKDFINNRVLPHNE